MSRAAFPGLILERHGHPAVCVHAIDPLASPEWDTLVAALPGATIFHTSAWARVLAGTYGYRPFYFTAAGPHGPAAAVPLMEVDSWLTGRRGVSLPFTDECAPLCTDPAALQRVLDAIVAHGRIRRWRRWELRGRISEATPQTRGSRDQGARSLSENSTCSHHPSDFKKSDDLTAPASLGFYGHRLALHSHSPSLFAACGSAARRGVRKAVAANVEVTFSHDLESVRLFYRLFCLTRSRLGLPPPPWRFFASIHGHVLAPGNGVVALARSGERVVAGAVFLHFSGHALFKFGASDHAFQHLRANNLVMWRAIEWHARAGFKFLDFGRTSLGNEGLRHFKLSWGATERRVEYTCLDCRSSHYITTHDRSSGWHNRVFRTLPGPLARLLGAIVYQHIA